MTLGEFREKTKDLPDSTEMVKEEEGYGLDDLREFQITELGIITEYGTDYWAYNGLKPRTVIVI